MSRLRLSLPYLKSIHHLTSPPPNFSLSLSKFLAHISAFAQQAKLSANQKKPNARKIPLAERLLSNLDAEDVARDAREAETKPLILETSHDDSITSTAPLVSATELFFILYIFRNDPVNGYNVFRDLHQEQLCGVDKNVIKVLLRYYSGNAETWRERIVTWREIMLTHGIHWDRDLINEALVLMAKYDPYEALSTFNEFFYVPSEEELESRTEETHNTIPQGMTLPNGDSFIAIMRGFSRRGFAITAHTLLQSFEKVSCTTDEEIDADARRTMYSLMVQAFCRNRETGLAIDFFKTHFKTTISYNSATLEPTSLAFDELIKAYKREKDNKMADRIRVEKHAMLPETHQEIIDVHAKGKRQRTPPQEVV